MSQPNAIDTVNNATHSAIDSDSKSTTLRNLSSDMKAKWKHAALLAGKTMNDFAAGAIMAASEAVLRQHEKAKK